MAQRHPELRRPVVWEGFTAIAQREGIRVRVVPLARPARLLRIGHRVFIQINESLTRYQRTLYGMHELCHFWRDDPGEPCYYAEEDGVPSAAEEFADIFAWAVTTEARQFIRGIREEDLKD